MDSREGLWIAGNPFVRAREDAESFSKDAQELNVQWWENLPMTYIDWDSSKRELTNKEDFSELEKRFLECNPWLLRNLDFSKFAGQRILEIGCGSGVASCIFAKAGAYVTAIDITEASVRLTKRCAEALGVRVDVHRMDAERVNIYSNSFDYVFSWGVLHHSANPRLAFKELARLLRPGGSGLIMVYNKLSLRYYLKGIYWLITKGKMFSGDTLSTVQRYYTDGYYHKHYTPEELTHALAVFGLITNRISITHMGDKMLPLLPGKLEQLLIRRYGWLLVNEFVK